MITKDEAIAKQLSGALHTKRIWGELIVNVKDFGAIGDGVTDDSDAINKASRYAYDNNMSLVFPPGMYRCTKTINFYEGVKYIGANSGTNWRPAPNSLDNSFQPQLYDSDKGVVLLFTGNGEKTHTIDHVSASIQNGYHRVNPVRDLNNDIDEFFKLKDFTNQDAAGTKKATLKKFSVAVQIVGDSSRRTIVQDIRIITSCSENGYGTDGYGVDHKIIPWARWDVGLFMQSPWRCEFNNVEVVGYWDICGLLIYPQREGEASRGYAEHNIFRNCVVQSSTLIRAGDTWPILSKTSNSFTVRYTPSHRFDTSGRVRIGTSFVDYSFYEYTGLTYDPANETLTFTGVPDTSGIEVDGNDKHHIITTVGGGLAHTIFYDCELYDFSHTTLLDDAHPSINHEYTACIEMSGNPMRAIKFYNTIFSPLGRVAIHVGKAWDIDFFSCYCEPRRWRSMIGGDLMDRGSVMIWGPTEDMEAEVGINTGNGGRIRMYGRTLHTSVNASPTLFVNTGYRYSGIEGDFFRPQSIFYDHEQLRPDARATRLWGNRGYEIDLRIRQQDGRLLGALTGFPTSGSTGIGDDESGSSRVFVPTTGPIQIRDSVRSNQDGIHNLGTSTYRWNNIYAANDTIQTSDERDKELIGEIPEVWLDAWEEVRWVRFKYKESINLKGNDARWHIGLIAQEVKQAFESKGVDPFEIGLLCYDVWDDVYDIVEVPVLNEEGEIVGREEQLQLVKEAGSRYAIRYAQAQAIEAAYQRREIERLKARID